MRRNYALLTIVFFCAGLVFAAKFSYTNNTYQRLAEEYIGKAERAQKAGVYSLAVEYAAKASENAALSEEFVKKMLQRNEAEDLLASARARLEFARSINADKNFPVAYEAAVGYYKQAEVTFASEDFESAAYYARKVLETLAEIRGMNPLPKFYIVQPWELTRDCFWNISGRSYVYNNPWLWENLYEANRDALPDPDNPNLILPGMKMYIPSITGEYREGIYDPNKSYGTYSPNN